MPERRGDGLDYVRHYYSGKAQVGRRIEYNGNLGTIIGASGHYLRVALDDGDREPLILHPLWKITYRDEVVDV